MQNTDLGSGCRLERADKNLFSVYQAIYSNADVEMWYDWQMRLNDTLWSDDCFFLTRVGEKLAGVIIGEKGFVYPFLVAPFCDRALFYRLLHRAMTAAGLAEVTANDVLDEDVEVLLAMGYQRTPRVRRVMVRPTDDFPCEPPPGFEIAVPGLSQDEAITAVLRRAYAGGVNEAAIGEITVEVVRGAIERSRQTDTTDISTLVYDRLTGELVAVCLAGVDPNAVNGFAGISDMGVLPGYQNRGLGAFLLRRALAKAHPHAPVLKLVVTDGNPAEALYRRLSFLPGPRFTRMVWSACAGQE